MAGVEIHVGDTLLHIVVDPAGDSREAGIQEDVVDIRGSFREVVVDIREGIQEDMEDTQDNIEEDEADTQDSIQGDVVDSREGIQEDPAEPTLDSIPVSPVGCFQDDGIGDTLDRTPEVLFMQC